MKKKSTQLRWLVTMLLLVTAMVVPTLAWAQSTITPSKPSTGDGSSESPYQISTAAQLYWFAGLVNGDASVCTGGVTQNTSANAVLTANITVNKDLLASINEDGTVKDGKTVVSWKPIGYFKALGDCIEYNGTFDGKGHIISGLYVNDTNCERVSLFGFSSGAINNVGVIDSYFLGKTNIGGICGYNNFGSITNCYSIAAVSGGSPVGGVCGYNRGNITNCYYDISKYPGGAIGDSYSSSTATNVRGKTTEQFMSGEVCYLLNKGKTDGTQLWYQNIDIEDATKDAYPISSGHGTVYRGYDDCKKIYSNNKDLNKTQSEHRFENGICATCGDYESATLNANDQYEISNAGQLYWFAGLVNGTFDDVAQNTSANAILTANITVNTDVLSVNGSLNIDTFTVWTPIGNTAAIYSGTFNGNGKTISGLYFNDSNGLCVGLFGFNSGIIKNVTIVDSYLQGNQMIGGVCGYNLKEVTNCCYTGIIRGSGSETVVGGVSGGNYGKITNCYSAGTINGNMYVGGVCAINGGKITTCYHTGSVSGTYCVGGVCGLNGDSITACYHTGSVSGTQYTGGVCGVNQGGSITTCYYLDGCNAEGTTFDCAEGTSKTEEQFNSGEVCYLLNGNRSEGTTESPIAWYQNIDKEGAVKDAYPVLDNTHGVAYQGTVCTSYYSNTKDATGNHLYPAEYDNGFKICSRCGNRVYQPATLNADAQYEIGNAGQLYWFAAMVNGTLAGVTQNVSANAILTADITVNKNLLASISIDEWGEATAKNNVLKWKRIGKDISDDDSDNEEVQYAGTFDGQGHTISGLYFNEEFKNGIGLFGFVSGAYIKNVGVVDSYFRGFNGAGGVCGLAENTTIENCYNTGYVFAGNVCSGGVCGSARNTTIDNCYNTGTVRGRETIDGGVCGQAVNSIIKNCYNTGSVIGAQAGGGVCASVENSTIENCYNTGSINGSGDIGGVCGDISSAESAIINCYNSGEVIGNGNALNTGGVCGAVGGGIILNCHNVGKISTESINVGGIFGVINEYDPCYYSNCYYQKGCNAEGITFNNDYGTSMTKEQFESGEVCYLLSQGSTVVNEEENTSKYYSGAVWGQEIGKDEYPVLGPYKIIKAAKGDNGNYWATFSSQISDMDLGSLQVYTAKVSKGNLSLTPCSDAIVAKGEGVLVKGSSEYLNAKMLNTAFETAKEMLNTASETAEANNDLVATPAEPMVITAEDGYRLYSLTYKNVDSQEGIGFYLGVVGESNDGTQLKITPDKAYLKVSTEAATNPATLVPASGFAFPSNGETTGLDEIAIEGDAVINGSAKADDRFYNLQGQPVNAPSSGLYIKNNKKVIWRNNR